MDGDTLRKLETAFAYGATVGEACYFADIVPDTYYRWKKQNPELSEKFTRLLQRPILAARKSVVDALPHDPELALKFLERKKKDEFSPRTEHTGADGEGFAIVIDKPKKV